VGSEPKKNERAGADRPRLVIGLGALERDFVELGELLEHAPRGAGAAFLVATHAAHEEDSLVRDLQAVTALDVQWAAHGSTLCADQVRVLPPGAVLALDGRGSAVLAPAAGAKPGEVLDQLLCALAESHGRCAVAIVLAGAAHEAARGLRAIREAGGLALGASNGAEIDPELVDELMAPRQVGARLWVHGTEGSAGGALCELRAELERTRAELGQVRAALEIREEDLRSAGSESQRAARQQAVAELGLFALAEGDVAMVLARAVDSAAETLDIELAAVLRLTADGKRLGLEAGRGWRDGLVGQAVLEVKSTFVFGYTLQAAGPVVVEDIETEERFGFAELLRSHAVRSGTSVVIEGPNRTPWGVLSVHAREPRGFTGDEVHFLQAIAVLVAVALARDDYERRLQESGRRIALAESEELLRRSEHLVTLGALSAGIAHEINNPIHAIVVNAEYGERALDRHDLPTARDALRTVAAEARRCGRFTHSVLEFSSLEAPTREPSDLGEVVRRVAELAGSFLRLNQASLELVLAEDLPRLTLDRARMEHAITSLLRNAAESRDGPVRVQIRTRRLSEREVTLEVQDDGPGIPLEVREHIFEPLFTTRRERGGTGLGLAVVDRIVRAHGGRIEVESSRSGSRFAVLLPIMERVSHA